MSRRHSKQYSGQGILHVPGLGIVFDAGPTTPATGIKGYAKGCLFVNTTSGTLQSNGGSFASSLFGAQLLREGGPEETPPLLGPPVEGEARLIEGKGANEPDLDDVEQLPANEPDDVERLRAKAPDEDEDGGEDEGGGTVHHRGRRRK